MGKCNISTILKNQMIKNLKTDIGIERNDKIIECLEDQRGVDLTHFYGEESSKSINKLFKKLK